MSTMGAPQLLEQYLAARDRSRFLRQRVAGASAELATALSLTAARRFNNRTLTLAELQGFAQDLASAHDSPQAAELLMVLSPSLPNCCVRNAHAAAKAAVQAWLARTSLPAPSA